ncbi:MAG: diphthine synthase [Candidatus Heimdallarchaeota archaeon]|nr:MAG: diphthine synthase [Candidatus Heimdallarchaeota archaeon]
MPKAETELFFIGMGLSGLNSCTLETLDILEKMDKVFVEQYTNFIPEEIPPLLKHIRPEISILTRKDLENNDQLFLENIKGKSSAILIPGDPFVATTHNSLRLAAIQRGFTCRIVHNASIISAAASVSGLSSYRFGRTVTCPFPHNASEFPYEIIKLNKQIGAHTLVLLDIELSTGEFLTVNEAISILLELEEKRKEKIFTKPDLVVGLAQIGTKNEAISAGAAEEVMTLAWRKIGPPQALIACAKSLHFTEEETLKTLWKVRLSNQRVDK